MKIIFDSEEQKEAFEQYIFCDYCPGILGLTENCDYADECDNCWRHSGLEMEVQNE